MLDAPGLFRLDVVLALDNMRTIVRNLSSGPLELRNDGYSRPIVVQGDAARSDELRLGHHQLAFTLGEADDAVDVKVVLATMRIRDRGMVRITGQATIARAG